MTGIWSYIEKHANSPKGGDEDKPPTKGRVLRVKDGYNPNSSSVGSAMPLYLAFAASMGGVAVLLLNLRSVVGNLVREQKDSADESDPEPPEAEEDDGGDV